MKISLFITKFVLSGVFWVGLCIVVFYTSLPQNIAASLYATICFPLLLFMYVILDNGVWRLLLHCRFLPLRFRKKCLQKCIRRGYDAS